MDTTPLAQDLWEGIGGHFDTFTQIIAEFVDNAISNINSNNRPIRSVNISISEPKESKVRVLIEDTGVGISNFQPVIRLGDKSLRESPLNEHGFGLKHALASANPRNDAWKIFTRTEENFTEGIYRILAAPFSFDMDPDEIKIGDNPWPGVYNGSGSIIEFECSETLFNTVQQGIRGLAGFDRCLQYIKEDLGYLYSGIIEKGMININIKSGTHNYSVEAVTPDWAGFYEPKSGNILLDLGAGDITIEYQFGEMKESIYQRYYKRNLSTSGVEIRINGRVLMNNVFKDIWNIENHPVYNHFLVKVNLVSDDREKLPITRTSKNGIRVGNEKLEKLYEWINNTHPKPHKETSGAVHERELVKKLAELKETHIRNKDKHIETEFEVFKTIDSPVKIDLYVFDGTGVILYEAKKDNADIQNIYQLRMYWDGAVSDGLHPVEGILLASKFSTGVDIILNKMNSFVDENGNNYNFIKKTWKEEKIDYPRP